MLLPLDGGCIMIAGSNSEEARFLTARLPHTGNRRAVVVPSTASVVEREAARPAAPFGVPSLVASAIS